MSTPDSSTISPQVAAQFAPTHWTVVITARGNTTHSQVALEKLCQTYWPPIYAYIRRQGKNPHDAQDLTQGFFALLLEKNYLGDVDRSKGKFRSFLLTALKHFLANEWDKAQAQKRGGGKQFISINAEAAETTFVVQPAENISPEKIFERRWALTLLDETLARLRDEYRASNKAELFEQIKETLTGERASISYAEIATRLKTSEGNIKVAVHRLRQRYREVLRAQIAETVSSPQEIEDELRHLFAALSNL
jgi:RNA polymerase sigma-70 factor (ECF subfamily)